MFSFPARSAAHGHSQTSIVTTTPGGERSLGVKGLPIADALFTQSPISVALYDAQGRVAIGNTAYERHFGIRLAEIPADYSLFSDIQLQESALLPLIRRAYSGEAVTLPPVRYDTAQATSGRGRTIWTQGYCYPVRDGDGEITHVAVVHMDVTQWAESDASLRDAMIRRDEQNALLLEQAVELEMTAQQLQEQTVELESQSEELQQTAAQLEERTADAQTARATAEAERARTESILESMADAHFVLDREFRFVSVNKAMEAGVAMERSALLGRVLWDVFPGAVGTIFEEEYRRIATLGGEAHFTHDYSDGRLELVVDLDAYATETGGIAVFWRDVTARERTAAALRASEDQLRTLADAIPTLAWTAQADGYIDWYNARWYEYTGTTPAQMEGWGWQSVHDPEVLTSVLERWGASIASGQPFEMTFPLLGADGIFRAFLTRVVPVRDAEQRVLRWFGTNTDVSAERAARGVAERAAERTSRLQSVTAALAGARSMNDVAAIVVAEAIAATDAHTAALLVKVPGTDEAMIARHSGITDDVLARYDRFPLTAPGPSAHCIRTGEAVWVTSLDGPDGLLARYPEIPDVWASLGSASAASLPLVAGGETFGALTFTFATPREFSIEDRELFIALARQTAQALERARLVDSERVAAAAAEVARGRLAFLSDSSAALFKSLDFEATLECAVRLAVPTLADYAVVDVAGDDGGIRRLAVAHRESALESVLQGTARYYEAGADAKHPLQVALDTGKSELVEEVTDAWMQSAGRTSQHLADIHALGPRSVMIVPLRGRERIVGMLTLVSSSSGRRYTPADLTLAEEFASRAGAAADNARLFSVAEAARARAESANKIKSEFLAVMSHELRTPLNAIAGYAELMELEIHGPVTVEQREALGRIQRSQRNLLGLINDVLNFAKLEAGRLEYTLLDVDISDVVDGLEPLVAPQLRARRLAYDRERCRRAVLVRADADKLKQILVNLLSNAIKFTPEGGTVSVRCDIANDSVAIAVEDTGIGIAAERLEQVFEPFVQIDRKLSAPQEGTGLGLSISRDLARGMGGDLTVESRLGEGSTFVLTLTRPDGTPAQGAP